MDIRINNLSLYYEVKGSGAPLLLLHGNGEDHKIFDALVPKLCKDFTVYAIDSRNHGQSEKTEDYSYDTMSEDIYQLIKALNLGQVDLIGFSDGAIIGLMLAMKHGDVIGRMALLGVNLKPEDFTEDSYGYVNHMYEKTKDPLFKMMLEQPCIELSDVKHIDIPILVAAAEHDIFKPETFVNLTEALPRAELLIMSGHDHGSYVIDQDILYPDLMQFFK